MTTRNKRTEIKVVLKHCRHLPRSRLCLQFAGDWRRNENADPGQTLPGHPNSPVRSGLIAHWQLQNTN